ncbi:hypothetical protein, partial [Escherichia coli]|uniref:hypothetical protein n=1 Tax=Escherichia coli TaxID=562 RepID=UPI0028E8FB47
KTRNGYRHNERTESEAQSVMLAYDASPRFSVRLDWSRSKYLYRIPGALTDSMFSEDPRQATRSRNYFSPDIHVPSITVNWQLADATRIQLL